MLRSLRGRLSLTYAVIAAAMLVVAYLVAERSIDAALVRSAGERLEIEAGLVVADAAGMRRPTATDLAAGDLAVVLGGYGTAVAIVDADGRVLAAEANGADPAVLEARLTSSEYADVITGGRTLQAVHHATDGGRILLVAAPMQLRQTGPPANPGQGNGQGQGRGQGVGQGRGLGNQQDGPGGASAAVGPANAVAQLAISLDGVDAAVAEARSTLQLAVVVLLLLAAAAVLLVTRLGFRPLDRVSQAAGSIAGGDLGARAALGAGDDEVTRLGRAFDDMADRVDATLRAQRAFAADASHELRSPLTVLGGYVDVLGRAEVDDATRSRTLTAMRREIDRLSRLSTDLLLLTQLEAGGGRLEPRPMDLGELAEDIGDAARAMAPDREVVVERDGPLPVVADPDRITQAVMNLVDNAVRHAPAGGTVRIVAGRVDDAAAVRVTNGGAAIPPEDLPRVFDRFYRAERTSGDGRNAGLGLAIVKAIVEASGGSVRATSADGETTFTILLPALR